MKGFADWLACVYTWVKDHDLPNAFTFIVTALWPLALIWWNAHKVNNIPRLLVSFIPPPPHIGVALGGVEHPAVHILFENQTGSIVYVTGPQLRNCSALFPIPTEAVRDIGENSHPLSFLNNSNNVFQDHQVTLQTNGKAQTVISVTAPMPEAFYHYKTSFLRRIFRRRKYFILEYTAMVGERRYSVSNIH